MAEKPPEGHYPDTVALNALLLEDKLIGLLPSVDKKIIESLQSSKHQQIFCRQGYTRCSVCVVSSHAVITEDPSIYKALTKFVPSIEALLISPGAVHLDGYAHGFIGGCCGLLDQRILAFTGDIRMHPDFAAIKTFLFRHGVQYYTLSTSQLEDIGGIMPLCE